MANGRLRTGVAGWMGLMCIALYIAADKDPPLVPWNEAAPGFNVVALEEHEHVVAPHFSKPCVRYLGAHTGCSCGFRYSPSVDDAEDERLGRASVGSLQSYVEEIVRVGDSIELYACWEGDWEEPSRGRREVTPAYFGGESFELTEREVLVVTAGGSG